MRTIVSYRWIKERLSNLNLFENEINSSNPFRSQIAIISTRVYILLLTVFITTLIIYTVLGLRTRSVTIQNPSQSIYEHLLKEYPTALSCQCARTAIQYGEFTSVSVQYHPICSSFFVSDSWIRMLFRQDIGYFIPIDFRSSATGQFQLLSSLCLLSKTTVRNILDDFLSETFLTENIVSPGALEIHTEVQSLFVRTFAINSALKNLQSIRDSLYSNRLQPALQTTGMSTFDIWRNGTVISIGLDGCFIGINNTLCCCSVSPHCSSPSGFLISMLMKLNTTLSHLDYPSLMSVDLWLVAMPSNPFSNQHLNVFSIRHV